MRAIGLFLFLALLASSAQAELRPFGSETVSFKPLPVVTDPHPLDPRIRYAGGYSIEAHGTSQVDGLSDLQLTTVSSGLKVEAISDLGAAVTFNLVDDGQGGFRDSPVTVDLLRQEDGHAYNDRNRNDAEDIAFDAATGTTYVAFERWQRVMAYSSWKGAGRKMALGRLPVFPANSGMEGLAWLADRQSLLIGVESGGFWLCPIKDLACREIDGPPPPGFLYMLTSLAPVPGRPGELLALYRYYDPFTGPRSILSHVKLQGDRLVKLDDMAKIEPPLTYDNYEGVAAVVTTGGYRLYLISDGLKPDAPPHLLIYDWTL